MSDDQTNSSVDQSVDDMPRVQPKSPREAIEPEPVPGPPPRSKSARHPVVVFLNFCLSVVMLMVVGALVAVYWGKNKFDAVGPLEREKTILISRGTDLDSIASLLETQDIVSNRWVFAAGVQAYKSASNLKAGEYLFKPGSSMREIMDLVVSGKSILHAVTVPEGLTSFQIVARLRQNDILVGEITDIPAEGSLLPETYKFSRGTSRNEIIIRMRQLHKRAVKEIWDLRTEGLPIANVQELVVLASIVEKETGRSDERTRVAGVFVNRLNKKMKLQSDPTVIYGLYGGHGKPSGKPIFRSDLRKKTAYNTYIIHALPPGPIANPGRDALEAVANPSVTKDLFFVADGTGGHAFAETLKEHNQNVQRWRKIEKKNKAARTSTTSN